MLRSTAVVTRPLVGRVIAGSRPLAVSKNSTRIGAQRWFADKTKSSIKNPEPVVLPGTHSATATADPIPTLKIPVTPTLSQNPTPATTKVAQVPLEPLPTNTTTVTSKSTPSPPPPPPLPKKRHRFRNFLLSLVLLTLLGYGGGIYASLKNDNFHDFFTEYVPYGEEIVMNIEEREFRRRFPNASPRPNASKEPANRVTIPRSSGATARISDKDKTDLGKSGPHLVSKSDKPASSDNKKDTSLDKTQDLPGKKDDKKDVIVQIGEKSSANAKIVDEKPAPDKKGIEDKIDVKQDAKDKKEHLTEQTKETASPFASRKEAPNPAAAKKDAPSKDSSSSSSSSSLLSKDTSPKDAIAPAPVDAHDPVIQDLVKIINTVISLTNETETAAKEKFNSVITSAKSELSTLSEKIKGLKSNGTQNNTEALKEQEIEFTKVASGIVSRMDDELKAVEARWRDEFERERANLAQSYQTKLEKEINQSKEIADQKLRNELLEQAVEMKRQWIKELRDRVEKEREGRLGKLQELSSSVKDLEKLTTSWTDVLDANLSTQKLHVALEAVRTTISDPAQPRPFIKELAALKEVSNDNDVVKAAIASINPVAYQKGLVSPSQIVDRFRRVSNEVRKASLLPDDAGVAAHASSWILSKLLFKKQGLATGSDVESILTRTETYLQEGELEKAAREMNQLQGWSKTLAGDWLKEVRVVLEVQQAVEVIAAQARLEALKRET